MAKVLVIAPHADDEILGCGATIARHVHLGDEVWVVIATNASLGAPELYSMKCIEEIRAEALAAHNVLGVKKTIFMDFPAPALDSYPSYKLSLKFAEVIKKIEPNILYIPHPGDIHLDHQSVYHSSLVAARPQLGFNVKNILCFEVLSETEWSPTQGDCYFKPNYFVDVSEYFNKKLEAMECYSSQLKEFPHPRSLEALSCLAGYRGSTVCVNRAEAFEVERLIL